MAKRTPHTQGSLAVIQSRAPAHTFALIVICLDAKLVTEKALSIMTQIARTSPPLALEPARALAIIHEEYLLAVKLSDKHRNDERQIKFA